MSKQNFFIISALITQKIVLSKTHSHTKKMFFAGSCLKGKPLFTTDQTQAFPFLKKESAELTVKCLNESTAKISEVNSNYSVKITRQTIDENTAQRSGNGDHGQHAALVISGEPIDVEKEVTKIVNRQRSQMPRVRL